MTDIQIIDAPTQITHHVRGRRIGIADRLQAAFGAFLAPEKFADTQPVSNDNAHAGHHPWPSEAASQEGYSLADPLALPPDWHTGGDLLSLSFLPFDR